jgi:hypothetical protein
VKCDRSAGFQTAGTKLSASPFPLFDKDCLPAGIRVWRAAGNRLFGIDSEKSLSVSSERKVNFFNDEVSIPFGLCHRRRVVRSCG